jgi:acyl-CoA reductase-like NAD-dependent aldehyde dehydrogenase
MRESQRRWGARSVSERVSVLCAARHLLAERSLALADAVSAALTRTKADTLVAEVLPLLDACKFLEREAEKLLRPRSLWIAGRPVWLYGVMAEIHREPLGHVLVIGPANFPIFLPGVQVLQALAAGNAVTWKPGNGGRAVALFMADALREAGLPRGLLAVTEESVAAAEQAMQEGIDKVVFTGSATNGREVLRTLSATATPAVMELSGADAVIVMPSANLQRVVQAVAFGLRLNGGAVCMSPRRLFATATTMNVLRPLLQAELALIAPATLSDNVGGRLCNLLKKATEAKGTVLGEVTPAAQRPVLVDRATAEMEIACSDIFAPVISLIEVESMMHVPEAHAKCSYGLTAAIFGDETEARALAAALRVGTVVVNDLIVPTADPRLPFGGRGASGFGVTRGAEGLLEMTAVKTIVMRRGNSGKHLEPTTDADASLFEAIIRGLHGRGWRQRWNALKTVSKGRSR